MVDDPFEQERAKISDAMTKVQRGEFSDAVQVFNAVEHNIAIRHSKGDRAPDGTSLQTILDLIVICRIQAEAAIYRVKRNPKAAIDSLILLEEGVVSLLTRNISEEIRSFCLAQKVVIPSTIIICQAAEHLFLADLIAADKCVQRAEGSFIADFREAGVCIYEDGTIERSVSAINESGLFILFSSVVDYVITVYVVKIQMCQTSHGFSQEIDFFERTHNLLLSCNAALSLIPEELKESNAFPALLELGAAYLHLARAGKASEGGVWESALGDLSMARTKFKHAARNAMGVRSPQGAMLHDLIQNVGLNLIAILGSRWQRESELSREIRELEKVVDELERERSSVLISFSQAGEGRITNINDMNSSFSASISLSTIIHDKAMDQLSEIIFQSKQALTSPRDQDILCKLERELASAKSTPDEVARLSKVKAIIKDSGEIVESLGKIAPPIAVALRTLVGLFA